MQTLRPAELTGQHLGKTVRFDTKTIDAHLPITVTGKIHEIRHAEGNTTLFLADPEEKSIHLEDYALHDVKTVEIQ